MFLFFDLLGVFARAQKQKLKHCLHTEMPARPPLLSQIAYDLPLRTVEFVAWVEVLTVAPWLVRRYDGDVPLLMLDGDVPPATAAVDGGGDRPNGEPALSLA